MTSHPTDQCFSSVSFKGRPETELIKAYCFQDWIVQRLPSGELKFVVYINTGHSFLPGSATVDI